MVLTKQNDWRERDMRKEVVYGAKNGPFDGKFIE